MDEWLDLSDLVDRVHDLVDMGMLDDAQALVDTYGGLYPGAWEVPYLHARLHAEQDRPQQAVTCLQESLRLGGHNADCYLALFYAHNDLGQLRKGARYLLRAYSRFPDNELILSAAIWYFGEVNRFADALAAFRRARGLAADNPDIFRNAGLIYQRLGDHASAEQCFRRALELSPLSDELHDLLADLHVLTGNTQKAIGVYEEFLKRSPDNVRALSRLVFCLAQHGDVTRAAQTAKRAIERYPNSPTGYVDLAYVYLNSGDVDAALHQVDQALAVAPLESEAYRVQAIALSERDRDAEADAAFRRALQLDPHNPEVMRDYYHHLRKMGDVGAMERMVRAVIRQERPYCVEDWWFLADHYWEEGRTLKAFRCLTQAHKSMPGEQELLPPLINIMVDRGHAGYAMPYLMGYVDRAGWDESMKAFARHARLQGRLARESLRFVRYYAERGRYGGFAFRHYLLAGLAFLPLALLPPAAWFTFMFAGTSGALVAALACLLVFLGVRTGVRICQGPPLSLLGRSP